jgi:ABC-type lipoprotein release transport system permease subunit
MNLFRMAWRNIWRNRRRTVVTMAAITLALWVMILYTGLLEGYFVGMERNILNLELGDVQVFAQGFRDNPSLYKRIGNPGRLLDRVEDLGFRATARLLGGGLAAAGESSAGVSFRGVNTRQDEEVSDIHKHVALGEWLNAARPKDVVVGRRLAQTLGVEPGDELVALSQAADGSIANDLYRVRGVLKGVSDVTDRTGVFMTAEAFRDFFAMHDGAHQIIVRRPEGVDIEEAAEAIRSVAAGFDVQSWREMMPTIASMLDSVRGVMIVVFFIIYIAIGILILNAMLMAVFERIREIGVLKALGFSPAWVLGLIVVESSIQTGLAVLLGLALSIPGLWFLIEVGINMGTLGGMSVMGLAVDPVWRAVVTDRTFTMPVLILVVIVTLAVIYPALKAAVIRPVEAMRHQ